MESVGGVQEDGGCGRSGHSALGPGFAASGAAGSRAGSEADVDTDQVWPLVSGLSRQRLAPWLPQTRLLQLYRGFRVGVGGSGWLTRWEMELWL